MPPHRKPPTIPRDVLDDLYVRQDMSLIQVSRLTNTNTRVVRDSLLAHGMRPRTKSEAAMGRPRDAQTREKLRNFHLGRKDSEETRMKKVAILDAAGGRGWNTGLTAASDARVAVQRANSLRVCSTPEFRNRLSERATQWFRTGKHWLTGRYVSPRDQMIHYYMSGWELRRFQELDEDWNVVSWMSQPILIRYEFQGSTHRYTPDILVVYRDGTVVLEEIKPLPIILATNAGNPKCAKLRAKWDAGRAHAERNGMVWKLSYFGKDGGPSISI